MASEDQLAKKIFGDFKAVSLLNRGKDILPFGYYNPLSDGKVAWNCDKDHEGRIISVFTNEEDGKRQKNASVVTMEDAIKIKNILVEDGWKPMDAPNITFTYPSLGEKKLNRKQRKQLSKAINKLAKKNPFGNKTISEES